MDGRKIHTEDSRFEFSVGASARIESRRNTNEFENFFQFKFHIRRFCQAQHGRKNVDKCKSSPNYASRFFRVLILIAITVIGNLVFNLLTKSGNFF